MRKHDFIRLQKDEHKGQNFPIFSLMFFLNRYPSFNITYIDLVSEDDSVIVPPVKFKDVWDVFWDFDGNIVGESLGSLIEA